MQTICTYKVQSQQQQKARKKKKNNWHNYLGLYGCTTGLNSTMGQQPISSKHNSAGVNELNENLR